MFIQLTKTNGIPALVNVKEITHVTKSTCIVHYTEVWLTNGFHLNIRETYNEVISMIKNTAHEI